MKGVVPGAVGSTLQLYWSTDNGSTYNGSTITYSYIKPSQLAPLASGGFAAQGFFNLCAGDSLAASAAFGDFILQQTIGQGLGVSGRLNYASNTNGQASTILDGRDLTPGSTINAIKIQFSSGVI